MSRSMKKVLKRSEHRLAKDRAFRKVIRMCARVRLETWITPDMERAYTRLHELGWAHSWETYAGARLIGGLYGVVINRAAFLESTFHLKDNAGKEAFVYMYNDLVDSGVELFDFQVHSEIAESFGAYEIGRADYEAALEQALA